MKGLDTHVFIRYLVQDDTQQALRATKFIETQCTDESPCFVGQIVLFELAWVLECNDDQRREQIASIIEQSVTRNHQVREVNPLGSQKIGTTYRPSFSGG